VPGQIVPLPCLRCWSLLSAARMPKDLAAKFFSVNPPRRKPVWLRNRAITLHRAVSADATTTTPTQLPVFWPNRPSRLAASTSTAGLSQLVFLDDDHEKLPHPVVPISFARQPASWLRPDSPASPLPASSIIPADRRLELFENTHIFKAPGVARAAA